MDFCVFGDEQVELGLPFENHAPTTLQSHLYGISSLPGLAHAEARLLDTGWSRLDSSDDLAALVFGALYSSLG